MSFVKTRTLAVSACIGAGLSVLSMVNDAYALVTAGLPDMAWAAIGAGLFFVSVLAILYKQHIDLSGVNHPAHTKIETESDNCVRPTRGAYANYLKRPHEKGFCILDASIEPNRLDEGNPKLVMHFVAFNAHYHTVEVTDVRGRFKFKGQEMAGEIELRGGNNGVSYGDETRFTVQQWISPQDVAQIRAEDGKHIRIQMVVLDIRAVATDPTTAEIVEEFRVFLPSELQFAKDNWHLSPAFYAQANR